MKEKINTLSFVLILLIFALNISFYASLFLEKQINLIKPNVENKIIKSLKINKNLLVLNEKMENLNSLLENLLELKVSVLNESNKNKNFFSNQHNLGKLMFSQLSLIDIKQLNHVETQKKNTSSDKNESIKEDKFNKEIEKNKTINAKNKNPEIVQKLKNEEKSKETIKPPDNKSEIEKDLEKRKYTIENIKYSSDDVKEKTSKVLDILKDIDEKQTRLISDLTNLFKESEKNVNEKVEDVKERTDKLKQEIELQKKNAIDISALYSETSNLFKNIGTVDANTRKISDALNNLTDDFKNIKFKIYSDKINSDNKMSLINKKLTQQLKIMYTTQILESQKQSTIIQENLQQFNLRIKEIKSRLPQTENVCSLLTNCGSCTSNPNCGWCSMSQECVPGTIDGPSNGQCSLFDYGSCGGPIDCGSYNNCNVI